MKQERRFVTVYTEGSALSGERSILMDTKTGVNYLWLTSGYASALTPLLGQDGNVIVSELPSENEPKA